MQGQPALVRKVLAAVIGHPRNKGVFVTEQNAAFFTCNAQANGHLVYRARVGLDESP